MRVPNGVRGIVLSDPLPHENGSSLVFRPDPNLSGSPYVRLILWWCHHHKNPEQNENLPFLNPDLTISRGCSVARMR